MRKRIVLASAALVGAAGLFAATAAAVPGAGGWHRGPVDFATLDADGNGTLDPAELAGDRLDRLRERLAERFGRIDADGNGTVDAEELDAARAAMREHWEERHGHHHHGRHHDGHGHGRGPAFDIPGLDSDGDGLLSEAEFVDGISARIGERIDARFARIDADGDGAISAAEFEAARAAMRDRWRERFGRHGHGGFGHGAFGHKLDIGALDGDGDGALTEAEFVDGILERMRERLGAHFARLDADGDGRVTEAELDAARSAMHERWRHPEEGSPDEDTVPAPAAPDAGQ